MRTRAGGAHLVVGSWEGRRESPTSPTKTWRRGGAIPRKVAWFWFAVALFLSAVMTLLFLAYSIIVWPLVVPRGVCPALGKEVDNVGVMYICWGPGCDTQLVCGSVKSLRHLASWDGRVFVLTDRVKDVEGACRGLQTEVLQAPTVSKSMMMKDWKRKMLDFLPSEVEIAVYVDADNFPVRCFGSFVARHTAETDAPIRMFPDNKCIGCNTYNGGFMIVKRTEGARKCLQEWLDETSKDDYTAYKKDQVALDNVLKKPGNACREGIQQLPGKDVVYMDSLLLPASVRLATTARHPSFQHFTTGIRKTKYWGTLWESLQWQLRHSANSANHGKEKQQGALPQEIPSGNFLSIIHLLPDLRILRQR